MKSSYRFTKQLILFALLVALPGSATFIAEVPLRERVEKSRYILKIHVLETEVPFAGPQKKSLGEAYLRICRCKVLLSLKEPNEEEGPSLVLEDEIILACPANEQFGSLKAGEVAIVFCESAGLVPSVKNSAWMKKFDEKDEDKDFVAEIRAILTKR